MSDVRKKWIFTAILAGIEILLTASNLGYHMIGKTTFTILHIPVFIATILIGLPQGVLIAAIFGCSSMVTAYQFPSGTLDYLFRDPRISVIPRLLIPFAVWAVYKVVCYIADDNTLSAKVICSGFASVGGVIANAAFVIFSLGILAPESLGITEDLSASTIVVTNIVASNIFFEIVAALVVTALTVLILYKLGLISAIYEGGKMAAGSGTTERSEAGAAGGVVAEAAGTAATADAMTAAGTASETVCEATPALKKPIKKTFRKWLFLFVSLTYFGMLVFLYYLFSNQDLQNAQVLLRDKSGVVSRLVENVGTDISADDLKIGKTGYVVIARDDLIEACGLEQLEVDRLSDLYREYDQVEEDTTTLMLVDGVPGYGIIKKVKDYTILSFDPDSEIYVERDRVLSVLLNGMVLIFLFLFELISVLVELNVVQKIHDVNESLGEIRAGNLNEKVTVAGNTEFEELSLGINTTVDALKDTMREIAEKNRAEMEFARDVQLAALPSGSLIGHGEYDFTVLGSMEAAREVGGDFYDYFMIGEDKLGFLVADVSGKGVPAALFMMRAKTLIKNFVLGGKSPAETLELANVELCANNESGMFVTVWLGVLELDTGALEFANAAHNPPLIMKGGEPFSYMDHKKYRRGLVLGGIEGTRYRNNNITLGSGDMLFLYTDGVTEATNADMQLYGEQRLLACLEANYYLEPSELIRAVRASIDAFAAGVEQYDDITMLVMKMV